MSEATPPVILSNSTYLDWTSWRTTLATTPEEALGLSNIQETDATISVALVLARANDPTTLLSQSWAERQSSLAGMDEATLWQTYGANAATYNTVVQDLQNDYGATVLGAADGYVDQAASRTIWVNLNASQFQQVFGTALLEGETEGGTSVIFWDGLLSVPFGWDVEGVWFDETGGMSPQTAEENLAGSAQVDLPANAVLGVGNSASDGRNPAQIAELYNFPVLGSTATYGTIALVEPQIGIAFDPDNPTYTDVDAFQQALMNYLVSEDIGGDPQVYSVGANQTYTADSGSERSLDVGIVAAVNPNATIGIYAGSGTTSNFVGTQQAIWFDSDEGLTPSVMSSSYRDNAYPAPGSPFLLAYSELYVDAALRNITSFTSTGDLGSGHDTSNGLANLGYAKMSAYGIVVGGTSASLPVSALHDPTLNGPDDIYTRAMAGDLGTIRMLVAGGMTQMPAAVTDASIFVETVWNGYTTDANGVPTNYDENVTGSGGVDYSQPTPSYQVEFGLAPKVDGPYAGVGRGIPDVAINAGGNLFYGVPAADMSVPSWASGTSAAAPLWAALTVRLNAIFADQGLHQLGYMNDLLYVAAAIAPASFNDVQVGDNISSFYYKEGTVIPTGYGYEAGPGYDLTTGLGSPNGLLLARALTQIAHAQVYYSDVPDLLVAGTDGWTSGVEQTLLIQPTVAGVASAYAWTTQFAQQAMQFDFSADLVQMFDGMSLGQASDTQVAAGQAVAPTIGGAATVAAQGALTTAFGFVSFANDAGTTQVARAVAVAELAGGTAQDVEVRLRQNGTADLAITLYKVDDYNGTISGLQPGEAGYAEAVEGRAYTIENGTSTLQGPGYGQYGNYKLVDVSAGDLIAMRLENETTHREYYGFSAANSDGIGHLWNYGLNTWGFEDFHGGGDLDYNDLLVQLDFTSAAGSGWLLDG